jgi:putative NADH-flavin reductase
MRITVFGATGGTGRQLVQQALAAGHTVTAVVRDPARLPFQPGPFSAGAPEQATPDPLQPNASDPLQPSASDPLQPGTLEVVTADVFDPAALESAVTGADLVVSALGAKPTAKTPVRARAAEAIVAAMRKTGARRLIVVTSAGHLPDPADGMLTRAVVKPLIRTFMSSQLDDYARTDAAVSTSGLDWTIVRPGWLTNGPHRPYRTSLDHGTRGATTISRHDLAHFMLATATDPATPGHAVFIGY